MLIASSPQAETGKDTNSMTNKTVLVQVCQALVFFLVHSYFVFSYLCKDFVPLEVSYIFTCLLQRKVLDYLLMLGVESQWAPVAVRCAV